MIAEILLGGVGETRGTTLLAWWQPQADDVNFGFYFKLHDVFVIPLFYLNVNNIYLTTLSHPGRIVLNLLDFLAEEWITLFVFKFEFMDVVCLL